MTGLHDNGRQDGAAPPQTDGTAGKLPVPMGSFCWKAASDELVCSAQLCGIFGFGREEPIGLAMVQARIHPGDGFSISQMLQHALAGDGDTEFPLRLLMPDGSVRHLWLVAHAIRSEGETAECIGAVQDLTGYPPSDAVTSRSLFARIAALVHLGGCVALLSDEIREPLSGLVINVSTCLRVLAAEPPNITGASQSMRRALRDCLRLSDMNDRLRELAVAARAEAADLELNEA